MAAMSRDDEAASRWKAIVESAVDGIVVIDGSGRIEAFNPAAERLFGYREADVLGQNVKMLMRDKHDKYLATYLATGKRSIIGKGREVTGCRRDGTTFPMHLSVGEMLVDGEPKFTGIIHDLSERLRMEQLLREQTALARLGEMAAVVAHEVRNPLAAIRAGVQTLERDVPPGSPGHRVVPQIVERIDALSELMHELLLFARPPRPRVAPVNVESLVRGTVEFLKGDPELANVTMSVEGDAPHIVADSELLKIVLSNVIVNSGQAMQGAGRVRVRVGIAVAEQMCSIAIEDNGPGIPHEVRGMIFTPFFTTKPRGTGLGLPTAKRLVEAHGGTIDLECPPGGGTLVIVRVPVTPQITTSSTSAYTR
jgi:two-component system sensor kinase FixL